MWMWWIMVAAGVIFASWAGMSLPPGTSLKPQPPKQRTSRGPYRWMRHPMYLGNILVVAGLFGVAGGIWHAIAGWVLTDLVMRDWKLREEE